MTNSRHIAPPMRAPRRRTTADKVISAGLATAACAGLIGVIGVRTIEESTAAQNSSSATTSDAVAQTNSPATSTAGLTQADLDSYAAQLQAERLKLDAYRERLAKAAKRFNKQVAASSSAAAAPATVSVPSASKPTTVSKPVAKPAPKPAAAPASKPKAASNTKSS